MTPTSPGLIEIGEEVRDALARGHPIVALESTIITHGMPHPHNLAMARDVEGIVRREGAVPATIAVIDGRPRVGLDADTLARLASNEGVVKASRRDLAPVIARRQTAGTTVAGTMFLAASAGIHVFATGGIGGVHRGADETFDVSADLIELSHSVVAVVCAGAKSILDIPKTLEYLETHGVPVLGYGTSFFPAFFARTSGQHLEHRCDTPREVADVIAAHLALGQRGGMLIANPIPESDALEENEIEATIAQACDDADKQGVKGKELTPFLLSRILSLTVGGSLNANIALVRNNAELGARVAVELARLQ